MLKISKIWGSVISLGLLLGFASGVKAAERQDQHLGNQFRRIEQPLGLKVAVTLGGVGLIAAQLWWFLLSQNPQLQARNNQNLGKDIP